MFSHASAPATTAPAASHVPADIHAETGHRLPPIRRDDLDADGQAVYDATLASATAPYRGKSGPGGGLRGPAGIQLHNPEYRRHFQAMNDYLRFHSGIPPRVRELVILSTAREIHNQFEWAGHDIKARREGIEPELIEAIRVRGPLDGFAEADAVAVRLAREAISDEKVSAQTYAVALRHFGASQLVNLAGLIGHYLSVAVLLNLFDMQMWPERKALLPPR